MTVLKKTSFPDALVQVNALKGRGFHAWLFCPSMLFQSVDTWWGDQKRRDNPHEGLDLLFYCDRRGRTHHLNSETKVPAMYNGQVVRILNDFLGKTIIMGHGALGNEEGVFCTMFGHTKPEENIIEGTTIQEGEVIASLADPLSARSGVKAHLHISMGLLGPSVSYQHLDWRMMGDPASMHFFDPLQVPGWHYQVRECNELL